MKTITTKNAPAAIGPYSQAVITGNRIYISGQLPIDPETGQFVTGGIKEETRRALTNIKNILAEAGVTMSHVVKVTILLNNINDFADVNEVYTEFFGSPYPARSAFAVSALPKGANIEIEAIAERKQQNFSNYIYF